MSPLQNSARKECVPMRIYTTNQIFWLNGSFESQIIQTDNPYFCVVWNSNVRSGVTAPVAAWLD